MTFQRVSMHRLLQAHLAFSLLPLIMSCAVETAPESAMAPPNAVRAYAAVDVCADDVRLLT